MNPVGLTDDAIVLSERPRFLHKVPVKILLGDLIVQKADVCWSRDMGIVYFGAGYTPTPVTSQYV